MAEDLLSQPIQPDQDAFLRCLRREGTPRRVHYIELFLDWEVKQAVTERFGVGQELDRAAPDWPYRYEIALQRFLGYDYVRCGLDDLVWPLNRKATEDTASLQRAGGRSYVDETRGPITTWEEFEAYPWPVLTDSSTRSLEWYEAHLPDDMCVVASGGFAHFAEHLTWLMGYETLCLALYDQRDLVDAIRLRLEALYEEALARMLQFSRVRVVWGSDDMGYRGGTLVSPDDTRRYMLPGHKRMAEMAHAAGRPYLLHSCGNLASIMDDLLDDVRIDGKHSFEDTIESVIEAKHTYGQRIALLGGIDVDFLCQADHDAIRQRTRMTLDACHPGGGYCLGTGNSVANYIPLESYLVMLDEGRRWSG